MNCRQPQGPIRHNSVTRALIAVGSNVSHEGNAPISVVCAAMSELVDGENAAAVFSRLYRTPAFPPGAGPDFINAALAIDWPGDALALLARLHEIERGFGRTRRTRWEARVLDLDLIALGESVWPDPETQTAWRTLPADVAAQRAPETLVLPHPRLAERIFVLAPLADIAPEWRHPVTGRTVREMLNALPQADHDAIEVVEPPAGALPFPPLSYK
ncbi:2-amino-4-hydroxy-6-hydroxymethyldihydropteridine diphosphokinase [Rhodophyticola sp.]|uniref:2-amino-4-hydroxy-6- hydroxymethyldihydropteridine diphosphokinase n=1 Tax=Rhodophyticola sp. TaxID=2680032 RepID=UPI003D29A998